MANYLNILTFLIPFTSLILLINASPQAYNSVATNNPARTAFMSLSPDVKKNFILMLLTSFNKTSSDIDASCQQVLNGQSSANIICQGLKDMESKQQAAFVDFTNSLQDPTLKAAATQFNQNVLQNNGMTMGEKCKQFFDYANSLNATNKMTLFKDMFKGHFDGYQGNGMSTFGNPQNNMIGNSGIGNMFSGAGVGQPDNSNNAQTSSGFSANPCNFIEHVMEVLAEKIQNSNLPSSS